MRLSFFLLFIFAFLNISCNKTEKIKNTNDQEIQDYLSQNNLCAEKTASGLYFIIEELGTGNDFPTLDADVTVNYTGFFTDNRIFDQGKNVTFPLRTVIKGWQEGIQKFKKNGKGKLLIPSHLGYGPSGSGSIPANTVILFDVEILDY